MGHRIQKEFSSNRKFEKAVSYKIRVIESDLMAHGSAIRILDKDNAAIRKVQKQQGQAIIELVADVDTIWASLDMMSDIEVALWKRTERQGKQLKKLKKQNNDLQKWLEGYIKLLFAIVVCFIIVVFVS